MIIGIVGSEQAKFTPETEERARENIRLILTLHSPDLVVSGGCHLGGVDKFAIDEAKHASIEYLEFVPQHRSWNGSTTSQDANGCGGYRQRNMLIAERSDKVYCITVRHLPEGYNGMRFDLCYHCGTNDHVKSGGCWTVKYAKKIGKQGEVLVID